MALYEYKDEVTGCVVTCDEDDAGEFLAFGSFKKGSKVKDPNDAEDEKPSGAPAESKAGVTTTNGNDQAAGRTESAKPASGGSGNNAS